MRVKLKIKDILQYFLVILIILSGETIWEKVPNEVVRERFTLFIYGGATLILTFLLFVGNKRIKKANYRSTIVWGIYFIFLLFENILIYKVNTALLFSIPTLLLIVYTFFNLEEITCIMDKFYNIVFIIAASSLIIYILYIVLNIIVPPASFPFLRNNWVQYAPSFYLFFYPQGIRNCAFFYEAPKFNVILSLALAYSCYIKKEFLTLRNIIILATVVSAQSVTGVLIVLLIFLSKLLFKDDKFSSKDNNLLILIFPAILVMTSIFANDIFLDKLNSASGSERLLDYLIGFKAWLKAPIFGVGIGNNNTIDSVAAELGRTSLGFSNGLFRILVQGGIYLLILLIFPLIRFIRAGIKHGRPYLIFYCFVFLFLVITTSFSNTLVYSLVVSGMLGYVQLLKIKNN